ncbi:MAG: acyl carrier protein [Bauldia sp.]
MTPDFLAKRLILVEAVYASTIPTTGDPEIRRRLETPDEDLTFAALEADSLARMEICIFIELRTGLAVTTGDLEIHPSLNALAEHLSLRLGGAAR